MKNTFGQSVTVTLFGESHGAEIGAVVDGLAPGIAAKAFIEKAVTDGIDYEVAKSLCVQGIIGSAKMISVTNKPIDELIKDVCSPKGATLEGLKILEDNNVDQILKETSSATTKRAYELSKL